MKRIFLIFILTLFNLKGSGMAYSLPIITIEEGFTDLRHSSASVSFPLTQEDRDFIQTLKEKVLEVEAAGLAACQLNVFRKIVAYRVDPDFKKYRSDIERPVPLTVLINPFYTPLEEEGKTMDWEGCFSCNDYGKVWRWTAIKYNAQDENGNWVGERIARGFEARLLQHEIGHCEGSLCCDLFDPYSPHGPQEKIIPLRMKELDEQRARETDCE